MKKVQTISRVFLGIAFVAAAALHASDAVVSEEEIQLQNASGEWHRAVWSSVSMPEFDFSVVRLETVGGELSILLLPAPTSGAVLDAKEEDHEVDPDPKRGGGRVVSQWTAQVSFAGGARTKEEDHEVDPDPKSGGKGAGWTRRLRFETAAGLGEGTRGRRELIEWFLAQVLPAGDEVGRFRRVD